MGTGALTGYLDVAQVVLYAFWIFFFGLIFYLRREDKREGYPLFSERADQAPMLNFPPIPSPKTFRLPHGGTAKAPSGRLDTREIKALPVARWIGAPLQPTGNPMLDGVGPASYAERADTPDLTLEGTPKIVPLRVAGDFLIETRDPDPRGMAVVGADRRRAGVVVDAWVDRSECILRYLEVMIAGSTPEQRVLLPVNFSKIDGRRREVRVKSILASQFAHVPATAQPDTVTFREEDRITAYYASGHLYAVPSRTESQL